MKMDGYKVASRKKANNAAFLANNESTAARIKASKAERFSW